MKIPDLAIFCRKVAANVSGKCVRFPGGAKLCVPTLGVGSPIAQLRALFMLINTALIPLQPFFNVLHVVQAIKACIDAVPDLLTKPTKLVEAIAELAKAFGALIPLFPQVAIPIMVKDILVVVSFVLRTIATELQTFVDAGQTLAESAELASRLNLAALTAEVACAQDNFDIEMGNQASALGPIGELLGIVNLLLELAGLDPISVDLSTGAGPEEAIVAMLRIADVIDQATSAIPI